MKSIRNALMGTLLAGAAVLAAGASFATAGAAGFRPEHLYKQLNLTADQQASIKAILTAAKPQMTGLHQQMRANHLKLWQTQPDDPAYGSVVAEVAQSNATLASQRTSQGAELRAQMYAVLTPPQKTQLMALQAQRAQR